MCNINLPIAERWILQGYARMTSIISQESCQDWDFLGLGGVFSVEWIQKESLPFHCTQHILNPWNDNKKVQISRDGQVRVCFLFSWEWLLPLRQTFVPFPVACWLPAQRVSNSFPGLCFSASCFSCLFVGVLQHNGINLLLFSKCCLVQELEPQAAAQLLSLWDRNSKQVE